eukprot:COSAG04_NODE_2322_length_4333_cov_7.621871_6_plen_120_part_00
MPRVTVSRWLQRGLRRRNLLCELDRGEEVQVAAEILRLLLDELLADGQEERVGGFDLKAASVGRRDVGGGVGAAVAGVWAAGAAAALRARDAFESFIDRSLLNPKPSWLRAERRCLDPG